jgi:hypothetical protein
LRMLNVGPMKKQSREQGYGRCSTLSPVTYIIPPH